MGKISPRNTTTVTPDAPSLRLHKATGQAYIYVHGRRKYLGAFDAEETTQRYHRFVAEWLLAGGQLPPPEPDLTIKQLVAHFWVHVESYYLNPDGTPGKEQSCFRQALRPLMALYADTPAADFGPKKLKVLMQHMISESDWSRRYINQHTSRIKLMFRWASSEELVPPELYHGLRSVPGLRRGRSAARETDPVRPVDTAIVEAVKPHVSRQVAALMDLQLLTAARPGELLIMRGSDIDTSGAVWLYTPQDHKNAWRDHDRVIYIGPRAQQILRPFLKRNLSAYLFSPTDAEAERRAAQHANRKTPMSCGNTPGSNRTDNPKRSAGDRYDVNSYRRAITRGCDAAFPHPQLSEISPRKRTPEQKQELKQWRKARRFTPHQLRHSAATIVRKRFGLEASQVFCGHRHAAITEVYAERDKKLGLKVAAEVG